MRSLHHVSTISIPSMAFSVLQYGSILAWFLILATTEAMYFPESLYNFNTIGAELLNISAFIGALIGRVWGGLVSD